MYPDFAGSEGTLVRVASCCLVASLSRLRTSLAQAARSGRPGVGNGHLERPLGVDTAGQPAARSVGARLQCRAGPCLRNRLATTAAGGCALELRHRVLSACRPAIELTSNSRPRLISHAPTLTVRHETAIALEWKELTQSPF